MRHRMATKTLNRNTKERKALMKNLVQDVVNHGAVVTTEARAKLVRGLLDKIIHRAQTSSVATRRVLASFFGTRAIVNKLVDEVAPAMKDRTSGFTRITRMATRRGDAAEMVRIELITKAQPRVVEAKAARPARFVKPSAKPAKVASAKAAAKPVVKAEEKAK
ncbi:MAG TPA: 50S ribosomal protein L17 [Candidatus Saccharimonadia bacterium]|nr:50S ribosomal protein L17 [Candidatus Saccharimonadia bacterium]